MRRVSHLCILALVLVPSISSAQSQTVSYGKVEIDTRTIPEILKERGEFKTGWITDGPVFTGVDGLIENSQIVIEGEISKRDMRLTKNRRSIETEFTVDVLDVTVGDEYLQGNRKLRFVIGGGVMILPGLGRAEVANGDFHYRYLPQVGERYVLFLTQHSLHPEGVYTIVGDKQGIFEIRDGIVRLKLHPLDTFSKAYSGKNEDEFRQELRSRALFKRSKR